MKDKPFLFPELPLVMASIAATERINRIEIDSRGQDVSEMDFMGCLGEDCPSIWNIGLEKPLSSQCFTGFSAAAWKLRVLRLQTIGAWLVGF